MNENLLRIEEHYDFNIPEISDVILNRYIKGILKRLSENVPSLKKTEITKLTMRERAIKDWLHRTPLTEAESPIFT